MSAVCMLGMMRTGTSLVAGILARLGVDLGPSEHLLQANRANPTGFGEHRGVIALNDEVLGLLGGSWYSPPDLPQGWEARSDLEPLRKRASALIESEFGTGQLWGWKDPRTCLTLPLWQSLVPSLAYVICLRDPVHSARSLAGLPWARRRLSHPFERGLELWTRYTCAALENTAADRRMLVCYDDLIADWRREASRLAAFIDRGEAFGEIESEIERLVQPGLRHQEDGSVSDDPEAAEARRLYRELRRDFS
jgi:hypothetical protein